jgi:hypothetical protein
MSNRIFLSPPHMGGEELDFVHEAFASNYIALGDSYEASRESLDALSVAKIEKFIEQVKSILPWERLVVAYWRPSEGMRE